LKFFNFVLDIATIHIKTVVFMVEVAAVASYLRTLKMEILTAK